MPDGMLRRLVECARYAPSGRNLQRGRWIVVRDRTLRLRIADLHRRASEDMARTRSEHAIGFAPSRCGSAAPHVERRPVAVGAPARGAGADGGVRNPRRPRSGSEQVCEHDLAGHPESASGGKSDGTRGDTDHVRDAVPSRVRGALGAAPSSGGVRADPGRISGRAVRTAQPTAGRATAPLRPVDRAGDRIRSDRDERTASTVLRSTTRRRPGGRRP